MLKIAITGPESSGKSSLTNYLSNYYDAPFCQEYARDYLSKKEGSYNQNDLDQIAKGQLQHWENVKESAIAFYDTEMLVMKVWSSVKYGNVSSFISKALLNQDFHHYLLCKPDIPWELDPLRENPGNREELFNMYLELLEEKKLPYTVIAGNFSKRNSSAVHLIDDLLLTENARCL